MLGIFIPFIYVEKIPKIKLRMLVSKNKIGSTTIFDPGPCSAQCAFEKGKKKEKREREQKQKPAPRVGMKRVKACCICCCMHSVQCSCSVVKREKRLSAEKKAVKFFIKLTLSFRAKFHKSAWEYGTNFCQK